MNVTENSFVDLAAKLSASQANLQTNKEVTPANRDQIVAIREQIDAKKDQVAAKKSGRLSEIKCFERTSTAQSSSTASEGFVDKCM